MGTKIERNKGLLILGVILLLVAVFGYGYYSNYSKEKNDTAANELYSFTTMSLEDFKADKVKAADLVTNFSKVYEGKHGFSSAALFMIEISDALVAKDKKDEAYRLLSLGTETITNTQMLFFLLTRAAVVAEDLGKNKEAVSHLERVLKNNVIYMTDKVYLDLGRLYMGAGNKEKAISSFKWIIDQGKEEEFKKMARLYLEDLAV